MDRIYIFSHFIVTIIFLLKLIVNEINSIHYSISKQRFGIFWNIFMIAILTPPYNQHFNTFMRLGFYYKYTIKSPQNNHRKTTKFDLFFWWYLKITFLLNNFRLFEYFCFLSRGSQLFFLVVNIYTFLLQTLLIYLPPNFNILLI